MGEGFQAIWEISVYAYVYIPTVYATTVKEIMHMFAASAFVPISRRMLFCKLKDNRGCILGMRQHNVALTADALLAACSICYLKFSRVSIITPRYRIDGWDVILGPTTRSVIVSTSLLFLIKTASVLCSASSWTM